MSCLPFDFSLFFYFISQRGPFGSFCIILNLINKNVVTVWEKHLSLIFLFLLKMFNQVLKNEEKYIYYTLASPAVLLNIIVYHNIFCVPVSDNPCVFGFFFVISFHLKLEWTNIIVIYCIFYYTCGRPRIHNCLLTNKICARMLQKNICKKWMSTFSLIFSTWWRYEFLQTRWILTMLHYCGYWLIFFSNLIISYKGQLSYYSKSDC